MDAIDDPPPIIRGVCLPAAGGRVGFFDFSCFYFPPLHGNAPANASDAMYRVARCAFSGLFARYLFITRTIWIALSPLGTHASLSLLGMPTNSSWTRKPSAKPATQPRQVVSRAVRAASRFPSPSAPPPLPAPSLPTLEQTSKKSRPDRLISACSGVLLGEVLAGKPTKKPPSSAAISSKRTAASHLSRDSTSDSRCCQPLQNAKHTEPLEIEASLIGHGDWCRISRKA
jgi:hypothetical protein